MKTILIIAEDLDIANMFTLIIEKVNYHSLQVETVSQAFDVEESLDYILLDRPFNLSSNEWMKLKELKQIKNVPFAITNSPKTEWLLEKSEDVGIKLILPYPCDLTKINPKHFRCAFL